MLSGFRKTVSFSTWIVFVLKKKLLGIENLGKLTEKWWEFRRITLGDDMKSGEQRLCSEKEGSVAALHVLSREKQKWWMMTWILSFNSMLTLYSEISGKTIIFHHFIVFLHLQIFFSVPLTRLANWPELYADHECSRRIESRRISEWCVRAHRDTYLEHNLVLFREVYFRSKFKRSYYIYIF